jgi:hypothetical protein
LHDIAVYLTGGTLERMVNPDVGKTLSRGLLERYAQMRKDSWGLWETRDTGGIDGIGSWQGHKEIYNKMRNDLANLLEAWKRGHCDNLDGGLGAFSQEKIREILAKARAMAEQEPPAKPDHILEQEQQRNDFQWPELPHIELPDWFWIIPRLLLPDPNQADLGQPTQTALTFSPEFQERWNALLAQGQQECTNLNALRQDRQASLAEHANLMNDHSIAFTNSLNTLQITQAEIAQAWNSLEVVQYAPFKTTGELQAELARETYDAEHGIENLVAERNAPIFAAAMQQSLELSRRPNTDGAS